VIRNGSGKLAFQANAAKHKISENRIIFNELGAISLRAGNFETTMAKAAIFGPAGLLESHRLWFEKIRYF